MWGGWVKNRNYYQDYLERKKMKLTSEYRFLLLEGLGGSEDAGLGYLKACLEEGGIPHLLLGLKHVADARTGISALSKQIGVTRATLYKALSGNGNPRVKDFEQILQVLGFRIAIEEN